MLQPIDLTIHERFGDFMLVLDGKMLALAPSKELIERISSRLARGEEAAHVLGGPVAETVSKAMRFGERKLASLFGEYPVSQCDVRLQGDTLRVTIKRANLSFDAARFDRVQAESFARRFAEAKSAP